MGEMLVYERRPITVDEFDQMVSAGIFDTDERVELIEGVLVSHAPPQGPPHASTTGRLTQLFCERFNRRAVVWIQLPIVVSGQTELEPDVALLVARGHYYHETLPRVRDVHAVMEVADTSLWYDRGKKLGVYAESKIPEYWIIDVARQGIQIYGRPRGRKYDSYRLALRGDSVSFEAFPDVVFSVDELLG